MEALVWRHWWCLRCQTPELQRQIMQAWTTENRPKLCEWHMKEETKELKEAL